MKGLWVECGNTDSEVWNSVGIGVRIMKTSDVCKPRESDAKGKAEKQLNALIMLSSEK